MKSAKITIKDAKTGEVLAKGNTHNEAVGKLLNRKVKIDGKAVTDEELAEFLDWSFVAGSKDFKMFKHLKESGYFDTNPITAKDLQKAMEAAIR